MHTSDPSLTTLKPAAGAEDSASTARPARPGEPPEAGEIDIDVSDLREVDGGFGSVSTSVPGVMFVGRVDLQEGTVALHVPVMGTGKLVVVVRGEAAQGVGRARLESVPTGRGLAVLLRAARGSVPGWMATVMVARPGTLLLTVEARPGAQGTLEVWASGEALAAVV